MSSRFSGNQRGHVIISDNYFFVERYVYVCARYDDMSQSSSRIRTKFGLPVGNSLLKMVNSQALPPKGRGPQKG